MNYGSIVKSIICLESNLTSFNQSPVLVEVSYRLIQNAINNTC